MTETPRDTILVVDDEPFAVDFLVRSFRAYRTIGAGNGKAALETLRKEKVDLVVTDFRMPEMNGLELLRACRAEFPAVRRVLLTAYDDLPEIVRARADGVVDQVLHKPASLSTLLEMAHRMLDEAPPAGGAARPERRAGADDEARSDELGAPADAMDLLRWTAFKLVAVKRTVLRPFRPDARIAQLEFVLTPGDRFERFREELPSRWRWPVKLRGQKADRATRKHPVVRELGLRVDQELYARPIADGSHAYLAVLPWQRDARITVSMGFLLTRDATPDLFERLTEVHAFAAREVADLPLPERPPEDPTGGVWFARDYDWVVTERYVGPDRRKQPTSFLNRHVLFGRRRHVPKEIASMRAAFVDRLSPVILWLALAYLALSLVDTAFTVRYIAFGSAHELNPVLRPILHSSPWLFVVAKNALSLTALLVVVRYQLARAGRAVMAANVAIYALLDLYWIALFVHR